MKTEIYDNETINMTTSEVSFALNFGLPLGITQVNLNLVINAPNWMSSEEDSTR